MATIGDTLTTTSTIVVSTPVTTNEFIVLDIRESVQDRFVRAGIELGPFTTKTRPNGTTVTQGSTRRSVTVWHDEEYDVIRDTWNNQDLIAAITNILTKSGT